MNFLNSDGGIFIIAEAGVNHNGDVELAKRLIEAAAEAKADAVKFQTWKPGEITGKFAVKVPYLESSSTDSESRYDISAKLCLPYDAFRELKAHSEKVGILFLSTPDGFESLDFLVDELDMPIIKAGSTEVTHVQFLEAIGNKGRPVIMSTGLSTMEEIHVAVSALYTNQKVPLALLQCTSQYPAPDDEMNLQVITMLAREFGVPSGLSDHSTGIVASVAAVALGATVIEKHFTLDRDLNGPDHAASIEPDELAQMIRNIRRVETMMGDGVKRQTPSELANMNGIRRSVVAACALDSGTVIAREMLICKRPASGVEPMKLDELIGMTVTRNLAEDEPITWNDVR